MRWFVCLIEVRGGSTEPWLRDGSRVLAVRWPAQLVPRGAAVVGRVPAFIHPDDTVGRSTVGRRTYLRDTLYVKLLAGRPGDPLPVIGHDCGSDREPAAAAEQRSRLSSGQYFVTGLAKRSEDSRRWGPVSGHSVWGVVVCPLGETDPGRESASSFPADVRRLHVATGSAFTSDYSVRMFPYYITVDGDGTVTASTASLAGAAEASRAASRGGDRA
jgi:hypothetical protein